MEKVGLQVFCHTRINTAWDPSFFTVSKQHKIQYWINTGSGHDYISFKNSLSRPQSLSHTAVSLSAPPVGACMSYLLTVLEWWGPIELQHHDAQTSQACRTLVSQTISLSRTYGKVVTAAVGSVSTVGCGCHDNEKACWMLKRLCGKTRKALGMVLRRSQQRVFGCLRCLNI